MKCIMVQGTTSDAGKSTLVAGLARVLKRRGCSVAPFKPQNMALNSAVTADGGEIGRAQALQAQAGGVAPHTDMNPVLLKPASDTGAQVIIHGEVLGNMQALDYHAYKATAKHAVLESFARLQTQYQTVLVEGAGSPAEINLRENDIANMGFACAVNCPVIIVADIDRGGVFAHIVGTLQLLSEGEQSLVQGFIINRFRGDIALLRSGLDWLEQKTGKPVLGVLPYLNDFYLDAEDAISRAQVGNQQALNVVVPVLPRISNHTDFDALRLHPSVNLQFVPARQAPPACDLMILPGSKNVRADLKHLLDNGWQDHLNRHLRYGGKLMGICGGLQMLGQRIDDPEGIEAEPGTQAGFNYLAYTTRLKAHKNLHKVDGFMHLNGQSSALTGYQIHCGISAGEGFVNGPITLGPDSQREGALSRDGNILATYVHGIFDSPQSLQTLLHWAGLPAEENKPLDINVQRETQLERLADTLEQHLDKHWLNTLASAQ